MTTDRHTPPPLDGSLESFLAFTEWMRAGMSAFGATRGAPPLIFGEVKEMSHYDDPWAS